MNVPMEVFQLICRQDKYQNQSLENFSIENSPGALANLYCPQQKSYTWKIGLIFLLTTLKYHDMMQVSLVRNAACSVQATDTRRVNSGKPIR